jgi:hypothetical protein
MAISTATIDGLPDYTNAHLLKLYRWGLANNAAGQTRNINGAMISFPSVKDMLAAIGYLEGATNADATTDTGGDTALVQFGEPV